MADNTVLPAGGGGDTIATDDVAGVKHQLIKLEFGPPDVQPTVVDDAPGSRLPVAVGSSVLPAGASTEATLAAIKAKTDNLDVALSTTQPLATQPVSAAALPLPAGASTEATLAAIKAKTDNLDVALSTTGPLATQPVSALALPLPAGASTDATIGAVDPNPGAYTLMDRLKQIALKLDAQIAATQRVVAAVQPRAVPRGTSTLLHRS